MTTCPNSFFSDDLGQALVRFQEVFVDEQDQGAIPAGSVIVRAVLNLQIASDIDSPIFNPDFYLYQVNIPWDEASTWNSLGNGLSGSDLGAFIGAFSGDNAPNSDGLRRLEVTEVVQAWSDGAPNHGFAILPEIIGGNDEGIEIHASEAGNTLFHPRLEITYIPPDTGSPADYDDDGDVDGADLSVFLSLWGTSDPRSDFDSSGITDGADLSRFLSYWSL